MKHRPMFEKYPQITKSTIGPARLTQVQPVPVARAATPGQIPVASEHPPPQNPNDLYSSIKSIIILGRITLIIPCSRNDSKSYKRPSNSWKVIPCLATIVILSTLGFQMIFDVQLMINGPEDEMLGVMNYISNMQYLADTIMAAIVYLHFLRNSDKFYQVFDKWSELSSQIDLMKDFWLRPLAYFLVFGVTPISFLNTGLVVWDARNNFETVTRVAEKVPAPVMEQLYKLRWPGLNDIIPYHPVVAVFLGIVVMLQYITMTYIATLVIFLSRAMSFQFRKLIEDATGVDSEEAHFVDLSEKDREFWQRMAIKHRALSLLVKTANTFLSPLIFYWVSWSVYGLSLQLYRAMVGTDVMGVQKQTFTIDFMYRTFLFLGSLISAAKVHTYAKKILAVSRNCPQEYYNDTQVYRLDHQVSTGLSIGFTGLDCFVLTKPFLLQVFSAIFTMEIILLQSAKLY